MDSTAGRSTPPTQGAAGLIDQIVAWLHEHDESTASRLLAHRNGREALTTAAEAIERDQTRHPAVPLAELIANLAGDEDFWRAQLRWPPDDPSQTP